MADKRITSRMKVYMTRIGVRDWLVAAESQKAALKAWDIHRNLFSTGEARVTNDAAHVALAMKTPGLPLAVPGQVLIPEEKDRPRATANPSNVARLGTAKARAPVKKHDRSKLDAAEEDLRVFERDTARQRAEIEKRWRMIEQESEAFDATSERRRILLINRIKRERNALKD